ncbi:hypothetical protein H0H92_012961, partial [Tricholoma furcatifolium]
MELEQSEELHVVVSVDTAHILSVNALAVVAQAKLHPHEPYARGKRSPMRAEGPPSMRTSRNSRGVNTTLTPPPVSVPTPSYVGVINRQDAETDDLAAFNSIACSTTLPPSLKLTILRLR